MNLDRRAVERLLALNDVQLAEVIRRLAGENGIDLSGFSIRPNDVAGIRQALSMATDEDIRVAAEQIKKMKRKP